MSTENYIIKGSTSIIGGQEWQSVVIQRGDRIICGTETVGGAQTAARLDIESDMPATERSHADLMEFAAESPADRQNRQIGAPKNKAAQQLGRLGGSAKSPAKTKASRENAKLGGWPKGKKRGPKKSG